MFTLASIVSAVLLSASTIAAPVRRAPSATDILVFKFAGVLEQLETEFYTQALAKFKDADFLAAGFENVAIPEELFSNILTDESTHNSIIESTLTSLGSSGVTGCTFNFGAALDSVTSMAATARVVENVGVSAYLGGANLLEDKQLLVAAATILTVEARHQTILNVLNVASSIPSPFDIALSPGQVLAIAGGFISGCSLGINATTALSVTNTGTISPGTSLTFSSAGIPSGDTSGLTCQMMTGGAPFALALPFSNCVVPDINGPVYIYVVNGTQPLLNNQVDQFSASILAGPTLAFIDSIPETLGQVVKAANATVSSSSNVTSTDAQAILDAAQSQSVSSTIDLGSTASATATATGSASTFTGLAANGAVSVMGWNSTSA